MDLSISADLDYAVPEQQAKIIIAEQKASDEIEQDAGTEALENLSIEQVQVLMDFLNLGNFKPDFLANQVLPIFISANQLDT